MTIAKFLRYSIYVGLTGLAAWGQSLELAQQAYKSGDFAAALGQVKPLADKGNAPAQVLLGTMNLKGQGLAKSPAEAIQWYLRAANQGNAEGQFYAGSMYLMGAGIPQDADQGKKLLKKAAQKGNSDAQTLLGLAYEQGGAGIARDPLQADMWFHLAAANGDPLASRHTEALEKQLSAADVAKVKELVASWKPAAVDAP